MCVFVNIYYIHSYLCIYNEYIYINSNKLTTFNAHLHMIFQWGMAWCLCRKVWGASVLKTFFHGR